MHLVTSTVTVTALMPVTPYVIQCAVTAYLKKRELMRDYMRVYRVSGPKSGKVSRGT